jgi:hypothetical protein
MVRTTVAMAFALLVLGCGSSNSQAPDLNAQGNHPANWVDTHWVTFNQNKAQCTACHGSYTIAAASGGISGVTCFQCHHSNGPMHPVATGWDLPAQHGATAKAAASLTGGFAHCAACHGALDNNADGTTESCMTCHTKAPHPDAPWDGTTASGTIHSNTDPSNAPECAKCHTAGANSTLAFLTPAPAGTAPGCFNNTLCHGNIQGHNSTWALPGNHGLLGAMAAPSATTGFLACQTCHGANYANGPYFPTCFTCHTKGAPHPDKPWSGASPINHAQTDPGNAPVCFTCHANGNNSDLKPAAPPAPGAQPGCLNNTLCHDTTVQ